MQGIKEIGSYNDPKAIGYTEWIRTRAGVYFVKEGTGEIIGPFGTKADVAEFMPPPADCEE